MDPAGVAASCPLCGSAGIRPWRPGHPAVLKCGGCGSGWVAAPPAPADLEAGYQEAYYQAGSGARFLPVVEAAVLALKWLRYRAVAARVAAPGSFLDVGCGRGDLLQVFHRRGWRVLGTPVSRTAAAAARGRGLEVRLGDLPALGLPRQEFDAITFFHVLEHLPDPGAHLREAHACMKDDGLLVVEVPNFRTMGFQLLGRRHLCYDPPHHLFFFAPRGLDALLRSCGFRVEGRRFFSLEYAPFTILQNWLNLLPGQPNRLYQALMGNREGGDLRRSPWTWVHAALGLLLAAPAALLAGASLVVPVGNTLRLYCRKAAGPPGQSAMML